MICLFYRIDDKYHICSQSHLYVFKVEDDSHDDMKESEEMYPFSMSHFPPTTSSSSCALPSWSDPSKFPRDHLTPPSPYHIKPYQLTSFHCWGEEILGVRVMMLVMTDLVGNESCKAWYWWWWGSGRKMAPNDQCLCACVSRWAPQRTTLFVGHKELVGLNFGTQGVGAA